LSEDADLLKVRDACRAFPSRFQTLYLSTVDVQGQPQASYAPYVAHEGRYCVYLSDLARHAANLRHTARASVLFIEGEEQAKHLFARERLTLDCQAEECARGSTRFEAVLDLFDQRFGQFMQAIRPLKDFRLFELLPQSGSYVAGFARAYTLDGADLGRVRHRNEQGHQAPDATAQRHRNEAQPS
jgi:putative heme iron utilization protein